MIGKRVTVSKKWMWSTCNVSFWPWQVSRPGQHHMRATVNRIVYMVNKEALSRASSAWLHPDPQTWSVLETSKHGGRVRPAQVALQGWRTQVPGRAGALPAALAVRGSGTIGSREEWAVHLPTLGNKQSRACQISPHIPGTLGCLPCPLPHAKLHTDTKATAKRQPVRDALIYVTPNTGRSKLGGGGKDFSGAAFQ